MDVTDDQGFFDRSDESSELYTETTKRAENRPRHLDCSKQKNVKVSYPNIASE